jgi:hypothetical protein
LVRDSWIVRPAFRFGNRLTVCVLGKTMLGPHSLYE